ncbi:MAG: head GIN domain-containing protein [Salibacteraceae bacterium]
MKITSSIAVVCSVLLLMGCSKEARWDCFKGSGSETEVTRSLSAFHQLDVYDDVRVVLVPDTLYQVRVVAWEQLIDQVETSVEDSTLVLRNNNRCNWVRDLSKHPTVYVHTVELKKVGHNGSEAISCADTLRTPVFDLDHWVGGGDITLLLQTDKSFIRQHTGISRLQIFGATDELFAYSASNGFMELENFPGRVVTVSHTGIGDIYVHALDRLSVRIEDIGNVFYSGSPNEIETFIDDNGKLLPR